MLLWAATIRLQSMEIAKGFNFFSFSHICALETVIAIWQWQKLQSDYPIRSVVRCAQCMRMMLLLYYSRE